MRILNKLRKICDSKKYYPVDLPIELSFEEYLQYQKELTDSKIPIGGLYFRGIKVVYKNKYIDVSSI